VDKLSTKSERNQPNSSGVIEILMGPNDTEQLSRMVPHSQIICTKSELNQPICSWLTAFFYCWCVMSHCKGLRAQHYLLTTYQISAKSNNAWRSYCTLNTSNRGCPSSSIWLEVDFYNFATYRTQITLAYQMSTISSTAW